MGAGIGLLVAQLLGLDIPIGLIVGVVAGLLIGALADLRMATS
jgi:hypothetical protein